MARMKSKFRFLSLLSQQAKGRNRLGPRLLARLLRDENGSYLIIGTIMLPVLIGVAGLASEGGLLFYNHRSLQSAADGAAYSAAIAYSYDTNADISTQAKAIVASYGFALGTGTNQANVTATTTTKTTTSGVTLPAITVSISRPQSAILSSMYLSILSNNVSATAIIDNRPGGSGNCLLALGKNPATGANDVSSAIAVQGGGGAININLAGCGVFSNSTDCTAQGGVSVALGGNAQLNVGSFGSAGCVSITGSSQICTTTACSPPAQTYTQNDGALSDPYAAVNIPSTGSAGSCNAAQTCSPGVYSGPITMKGGTWTLQPGVYIFEGGLTVGPGGGGTTVNGNGVTLVFTSASPGVPSSYPSPQMSFLSQANVNLTAPTTGPTAGFVIMGDRTMPIVTTCNPASHCPFNTDANSNVNLNGVVYLPNGYLSWQGVAATAIGCRQFIVNMISMGGTPGLNNTGCNLSGGGGGTGTPIGSIVTLVQ